MSAVATAPAWRRRGVASALLDALDGRRAGRACFLHVADDNGPARALYEARGFVAKAPDDLDPALSAGVALEIEGSDEAQALLFVPGAPGAAKTAKAGAKKRKRAKRGGFAKGRRR